ncbi:hypothetical protein CPJCM30710_25270 [Clostridium polyendosporum]|uniref:Uncharacterized protein n=1 Tax=Clostridium polyendosporum TaxID=69208 RepID=A0A919S1Z2_9CLOT|nr:hypothetical protein [Clostridium polyendosporum]GIM29861.1 hypothetical protein CPJCM30710_25270 [Clostridium polyendosporum]
MNIKKYLLGFLIIAFLIFAFIDIVWNSNLRHNIIGNKQWTQKKKEFKSTEISKITFYTGGLNGKNIELTEKEKDNFIINLINSKFYKSNWRGMIDGGIAITIVFNDGTKDYFEYCGESIFQITYNGKMFSIRNKELEKTLLSYNVTL